MRDYKKQFVLLLSALPGMLEFIERGTPLRDNI